MRGVYQKAVLYTGGCPAWVSPLMISIKNLKWSDCTRDIRNQWIDLIGGKTDVGMECVKYEVGAPSTFVQLLDF